MSKTSESWIGFFCDVKARHFLDNSRFHILEDLLTNRSLWFVIFNPFHEFLSFKVRCFWGRVFLNSAVRFSFIAQGGFRLGNFMDLGFKIRILDLQSNAISENGFQRWGICVWISLLPFDWKTWRRNRERVPTEYLLSERVILPKALL